MSDFLIQVGFEVSVTSIGAALRNRPGLEHRPICVFELPWGTLTVQLPVGHGYEPNAGGGDITAVAGRPRFVGVEHELRGPSGFCGLLAERLEREPACAVSKAMTGMFAGCRCSATSIQLFTDRMFRPLYVCRSQTGTVVGIGTHVETLAVLGGRALDFDEVSLAELMLYSHVTFPFTTHRGIEELPPGSVCTIVPGASELHVETCWTPQEPAHFSVAAALERDLADALQFAGEDICRGIRRAAVTLSGGRDSRAVIASIPRERLAGAVTYCTRENRETEIAGRVAATFGIPHLLARRDPDFYATLLDRATRLLGTELKAAAHGYAILDAGLENAFDLFIGGQFSDTLLKDYFMPLTQKEELVGVPWRERLKRLALAVTGRERAPRALETQLTQSIRQRVSARQTARFEAVADVRRRSASEWVHFWPTSRHHVSSHTLGNSRLFAFESLFMHSAVVDVAIRIPPELRVGGKLAERVFSKLYGPMASIENANTGLPLDFSPKEEARELRRLKNDPARWRAFTRLPPSEHPWNDIHTSWVDAKLLQRLSPRWQQYREQLLRSPALDVVGPILSTDIRRIIAHYQEDLGPNFNQVVIQLTYHIDRLLSATGSTSELPIPPVTALDRSRS